MANRKRWGKKYEDNRDWKKYNSKLIKRGEFYINPFFLETWIEEIKEMNKGKVGEPYLYPETMIEFLAVLHEKNFDCRALEGIMRSLSKQNNNFPVISYSQINRRINKMEISFDIDDNNLVVGLDGSGNKVSNRGEWIRHKWKIKKGWVKVVVMGTTKGQIVDVRIGNEDFDEKRASRGMLRKNHKKINKAIFDGLHDCEDTFNLCKKLKIKPVIKIRKNAVTSLSTRGKEVRLYKEIGYKKWAKKEGYGFRWPATEGIFSGTKRIFGECLTATKKSNLYKQAKRKLWAYNKLQKIT